MASIKEISSVFNPSSPFLAERGGLWLLSYSIPDILKIIRGFVANVKVTEVHI